MATAAGMWWGTVRMGQVRLAVCAGSPPVGWPAGGEAELCACADARDGADGAALRPLVPAPGAERAYGLLAAALAADGSAGLLRTGGPGGAELRLVSVGGALAVVEGRGSAADAPGEEEVALARALLRAMPRRLPARPAAAEDDALRPPAPVLDLGAARALRRRAS